MIRYGRGGEKDRVWNKHYQSWQIGPMTDDSLRTIWVGRVNDGDLYSNTFTAYPKKGARSNFRQMEIDVTLELASQLDWNTLCEQVLSSAEKVKEVLKLSDITNFMEIFPHLKSRGSCNKDFQITTINQENMSYVELYEKLLETSRQEPNYSRIDRDYTKEVLNYQDVLRRAVQNLGATIIVKWIKSNLVTRYYTTEYNTYASPTRITHVLNLLRGPVCPCGKNIQGTYPTISHMTLPNIYTKYFGYGSSFDYCGIDFFYDDDEQVCEYCDECVREKLFNGTAYIFGNY